MEKLFKDLQAAATEEEVKFIFAKFFNLKLSTKNYIDLYTPQILFEFKFDANLENLQTRAKIFAQTMYYVRRLKYGLNNESRALTNFIGVVTKFAAVIIPTKDFKKFYTDPNYDWDLAPSTPHKDLIDALANSQILRECKIFDFKTDQDKFSQRLRQYSAEQLSLFPDKKIINEDNFFEVFEYWQNQFARSFIDEDERKPSEYFITDIEKGKSEISGNNVIFTMSDNSIVKKKFFIPTYQNFWNKYEKISAPREIISIRQKMDRMTEINRRRFTGEFFTPVEFAKKAVDYLARTLGKDWYKKGNFRLWDMAAGTGNLEFALPAEALPYCYISTLLEDDAKYCKKIFPTATVFQYDYLNDDVEFLAQPTLFNLGAKYKMPKNLRDDLDNPKIKWIIFINPPYATANNDERDKTRINKDGVSMTEIRKLMTAEGMGETSRELLAQFIYRISKEFKDKKVWLGMFSKINYVIANNDQKLRDKIFNYKYERGFVFSSQNFQGCKGKWPVGFLIWNLEKNIPLEEQKISLDLFNENVEKIAVKNISAENRADFLNKWIKRPPATKKFPPLSGALNVAAKNKDRRDRIAENFLASFMCKGNEFCNQTYTSILSGPYVSAGALSIIPENFWQCMIIHAVRRLPKATWLNDRDQFMQPTKNLSAEFITDAVIWSLFAPSNQTVSLRNVKYEGQTYQLKNNLYPFKISEIKNWQLPEEFAIQLELAQEDRFAALWLEEHAAEISAEGCAVLATAKEIYKFFYAGLLELIDWTEYRIENWDVGWYQIRMSIKNFDKVSALQIPYQKLSEKLLPQIYELGFLRDEVIYFE